MAIRRRAALIGIGIAALLLLALIFVVPALINVDHYRGLTPSRCTS
jgi:predicted tellurium resistance membrane protein TerC